MGLLGMLIRGTIEAVQNKRAKNDLEGKLGRSVTEEEQYSLGAHLQAAQPNAPNAPMISTPRESSTPFADAKPPMRTGIKLLIAGIILLIVVIPAGAFFVMIMTEKTYNHLNPFTPKPPAGSMPDQIGEFNQNNNYDWISGKQSYQHGEHFESTYKKGGNYIYYKLWNAKSPEELQTIFAERKKEVTPVKSKIAEDTDSRFGVIDTTSGALNIVYKEEMQVRVISGTPQAVVNQFESALRNQPPREDVSYTPEAAATPTPNPSSPVMEIIAAYKKNFADADTKYSGKPLTVSGKVQSSTKDKNGEPLISILRPGAVKPTDGMIICTFDKSLEYVISKIKTGDSITMTGKISVSVLDNVMLDNCTKQ